MKTTLLLTALLVSFVLKSQSYQIEYKTFSNGSEIENQNPIVIYTDAKKTYILNEKIIKKKEDFPFEISLIDHTKNWINNYTFLKDNEIIMSEDREAIAKQSFEMTTETKKILGYNCIKAIAKINSNTIEVWFTNELQVKGSPQILGQDLGLVLEIERNKNFLTKAINLKKIKTNQLPLDLSTAKSYDIQTYRDLVWKSRFTTIPIFKDEVINFSDQSKSDENIMRFANGTIILKKIKLPKIEQGNLVFAELKEQSNGDAYDRTGSVFIIPDTKKLSFLDGLKNGTKELPTYQNGNGKIYQGVVTRENYDPTIELMRFFTPFGIQKFNHIELKDKTWHNSVPYRQDITELIPQLTGKEIWIGVFIGNYDKGGHQVSLDLTIHNNQQQVWTNTTALPLFNTTNIMEMAGQEYATMFNNDNGLLFNFTLEKDLNNAQLRYITTGHGGWENGDEFLPKINSIFLDGKLIHELTPWRIDCGSYRLYNPASGNFPDGLSSSDLSRSNWCPGKMTNPNYIKLGNLKAGQHSIQVKIPQGAVEGNSFSSWNISGVLLGK